MLDRTQVTILLSLAVGTWWLILIFNGINISSEFLKPFTITVTVILIMLNLFDLWLWKLNFLHGWLVKKPNISGTWKIQIVTNWIDPELGTIKPPSIGYIVIKQTYSQVFVQLFTDNSESDYLSDKIIRYEDGAYSLISNYRNIPHFHKRNFSQIHHATMFLKYKDKPHPELVGQYWTDRSTAGEINTLSYIQELANSYMDAEQKFTLN